MPGIPAEKTQSFADYLVDSCPSEDGVISSEIWTYQKYILYSVSLKSEKSETTNLRFTVMFSIVFIFTITECKYVFLILISFFLGSMIYVFL